MKTKNEKRDIAVYYKEEGDEGFSPERNKAIIENSIKKYEAKRKAQADKMVDKYGERADAVVSYIRAVDRGMTPSIESYLGKKYLAYLRGQELLAEMRIRNAKKKS